MTFAIFDFADIRSRMLGDDKPVPKPPAVECPRCSDTGWDLGWRIPGTWSQCPSCLNPKGLPHP